MQQPVRWVEWNLFLEWVECNLLSDGQNVTTFQAGRMQLLVRWVEKITFRWVECNYLSGGQNATTCGVGRMEVPVRWVECNYLSGGQNAITCQVGGMQLPVRWVECNYLSGGQNATTCQVGRMRYCKYPKYSEHMLVENKLKQTVSFLSKTLIEKKSLLHLLVALKVIWLDCVQ